MLTLFVATSSAHKLAEIRAGLSAKISLRSVRDIQDPLSPVENGATFAENAAIKAVTWASFLGMGANQVAGHELVVDYVIADDSGLEVDALQGQPGVHSARFAALDGVRAGNSPDAENNAKLIRLLASVPPEQRRARFRCVLALTPVAASPIGTLRERTRFFDGVCEGSLRETPAGSGGFGYDPLFVPEGFKESFAELGSSIKGQISHRARALRVLAEALPDP